MAEEYRVERDSLGEVRVPQNAYWGAQTQRALENFPISGVRFPRAFVRALGLVKLCAARVNRELGLLDERIARAIEERRLEGAVRALRVAQRAGRKAQEFDDVVKTGRTHLMDAMPVRLGQEFSGYAHQIALSRERLEAVLPRLYELAIGGTAVGTGINTHPEFGRRVAEELAKETGLSFRETRNHFAAQAAMETAAELSGALKALAVALYKIANDLRWMNSGPLAGLAEVRLPALQPGSSIMPGKVNPVIPEAVMMVAMQAMGADATVAAAAASGNFELNVALPVIAHNLLFTLETLANACRVLAEKGVEGLVANRERMERIAQQNPILATALAPHIGYDRAAEVVKRALAEGKTVRGPRAGRARARAPAPPRAPARRTPRARGRAWAARPARTAPRSRGPREGRLGAAGSAPPRSRAPRSSRAPARFPRGLRAGRPGRPSRRARSPRGSPATSRPDGRARRGGAAANTPAPSPSAGSRRRSPTGRRSWA